MDAFEGYGAALALRRALLPALALVLVPTLVAQLIVRLLIGGTDTAIVNGTLIAQPATAGILAWLDFGLGALGWLAALLAGIAVLGGHTRGAPIGPVDAVKEALKRLVPVAATLMVCGLIGYGAVLLAGLLGWFVVLLALIALAIVFCRIALVVPGAILDRRFDPGHAWRVGAGRAVGVVTSVFIGVVLLPFLGLAAIDLITDVIPGWVSMFGGTAAVLVGAALELIATFALAAIVAGQAGALTLTYLLGEEHAAAARSLEPSPAWRGAAGLALPALLVLTFVTVNPEGLPSLQVSRIGDSEVVAAGWPAGQHPVIVTTSHVYDCHDDACRSYEKRFHSSASPHWGASAVAGDGSVLSGYVFRQDVDRIDLAHCTRTGDCETGRISLPAFIGHPPVPRIGLAKAADGALLIAVAQQRDRNEKKVDLSIIRCATVKCAEPTWGPLATIKASLTDDLRDGYESWPAVRLNLSADGRPLAAFRFGPELTILATCAPVTCADPRTAENGNWNAAYAPLSDVDGEVIGLGPGNELRLCRGRETCATIALGDCCSADEVRALAAMGRGWLTTTVRYDVPPDGLEFTIGKPQPKRSQVILWHCAEAHCPAPKRIALNVSESPIAAVHLITNGSQVLVLEESRGDLLLVSLRL